MLEEPFLQVEPGAERRTRLTVRNGGDGPERYRLEILGDAARWAQVEPRHLAVAPDGQEHPVEVVFRPPHAPAAPDLEVPFGVRVLSLEHRDRAAVVEGDVLVTAVPGLSARIDPPAAAGRWGAGFRVHFESTAPVPLPLRVTAADPPKGLGYAVAPAQLTVDPGVPAEALVAVRARTPKLVGAPVRHSFAVDYRADTGASAGRLPAVFEQRAVLPTPVFAVLAVLAAALVVGAGLLALPVLRPAPAAGPSTAAAPGPAPAASAPGGGDVVQGWIALYAPPTPVDDTAGSGAAQRLAEQLRATGAGARVVDSRDSAQLDDGPKGLLLVLRDGFPDRAAAEAECAAHRDLAPRCVAVAPR